MVISLALHIYRNIEMRKIAISMLFSCLAIINLQASDNEKSLNKDQERKKAIFAAAFISKNKALQDNLALNANYEQDHSDVAMLVTKSESVDQANAQNFLMEINSVQTRIHEKNIKTLKACQEYQKIIMPIILRVNKNGQDEVDAFNSTCSSALSNYADMQKQLSLLAQSLEDKI